MGHFADDLVRRQRRLGHPLCVGLDPHLDLLPELFRRGPMTAADPRTADAVEGFLGAIVDLVAGRVAIVKPQIALFEQLGWPGLRALDRLVGRARRRGLLVLLDAKRGDIGSTARGYADAYLGADAALPADALTVNPYLGGDALEPFVERAAAVGAGLFVLVKTSNAGAADLQDRRLAEGGPLWEAVAATLVAAADRLTGPETGFSSLGVVAGATWPGDAERLRELLPRSLFLVPGYGAQGGTAGDALAGFVRGSEGRLEGGLVNSSRAVLFPPAAANADAAGWERAIEAALDEAIEDLASASAAAAGHG